MLKLVFKQDGSVKVFELPTSITQGSSGEIDALKLCVAVDGLHHTDYSAIAKFKLADGDETQLSFLNTGVSFDVYGEAFVGKSTYLTEAETRLDGILKCSIEVTINEGSTLYTYVCNLVINPTNYDPDSNSSKISNAQYKNLTLNLTQIQNFLRNTYEEVGKRMRFYDTYDNALADIDNLETNEPVYVLDRQLVYSKRYQGATAYLKAENRFLNLSSAESELTETTFIKLMSDPYHTPIVYWNISGGYHAVLYYEGEVNGEITFKKLEVNQYGSLTVYELVITRSDRSFTFTETEYGLYAHNIMLALSLEGDNVDGYALFTIYAPNPNPISNLSALKNSITAMGGFVPATGYIVEDGLQPVFEIYKDQHSQYRVRSADVNGDTYSLTLTDGTLKNIEDSVVQVY